ncbi:MAG: DUF1475 family protein [Candidatus Izemoplasmataceae bacterium]
MKIAKVITFLGALSMTIVLIYGFTIGDFSEDGSLILNNPWGIVSLVDLYVGFSIFSLWIIYREKNIYKAILLVIFMMVFGFLSGALYTLYAINQSKGDVLKLFLGDRYNDVIKSMNS